MTGLFFGSFNPLHNGHLGIAHYILDKHLCDEVWFIVSPKNPLKKDMELLDEHKRKEMLEVATASDHRIRVSDIEFKMPRPSYTIDTLEVLSDQYPEKQFALIMGEDNLKNFHLWKEYQKISSHYPILVYPRPGIECPEVSYPNVTRIDAPLSPVSSTDIRLKLKNGESVAPYVPASILDMVIDHYA